MKITGKEITLVNAEPNDNELNNLVDNVDELFNMSETRIYPENLPLEIRYRIERSGKLIGEVKLSRIRWYNRKAELGILITKDNRYKGVGSEALALILEHVFHKMNLHRVEAEVIENNLNSIKLVENFGFMKEGTLREAKYAGGKYIDIFRYGLLKEDYEKMKRVK